MADDRISPKEYLRRHASLMEKYGSVRRIGDELGIPESTIRRWLENRERYEFTAKAPRPARVVSHTSKLVRRFILSAAQDGTEVHEPFFDNLKAYAEEVGAEIHIGGFTYNKRLFEENRVDHGQWFHPSVVPFMDNRRIRLGSNLDWCAEMNTLPTASDPLEGFETYTNSRWGVFPHAKVQLKSIATMKGTPAKLIMTTGAVTVPNYVQKRAGIRAHQHHVIGAVLVEIDTDGATFCRHLIAEDDGSFQDLDVKVRRKKVTYGHTVEGINWGDIHIEKMDPVVDLVNWGDPSRGIPGMIDVLKPRYQFFHDTIDFHARLHHNLRDPHVMFEIWCRGRGSVDGTCKAAGDFLAERRRPFCKSVVVRSNHDEAFERWLRESDWRRDPENAEVYLEVNLALLRAIKEGRGGDFKALEWGARKHRPDLGDDVRFLKFDESFTICDDEIECGMHGHLGSNGSFGSPKQFARMGPKANTGDTHSCGIIDGIYTAGVSGMLDMGYNKGLSSWSHTHIVTYKNGKRALVTIQKGKWRAST